MMNNGLGLLIKNWWGFVMAGLALAACASPVQEIDNPQLSVAATTTILGDVVRQVAGEYVQVSVLLPTGADPHAFEPKPADVALIADADLVFANGAGLETFLEPLLQNAGGSAKLVSVSEGIDLMKLDEQHQDETGTEEHGEFDPHVWLDPRNVMVWVENITKALSEEDPAHAKEYQANADQYIQALEQLDAKIEGIVAEIPQERRLLVTDHHEFGYFARRYGFVVIDSIIPGFSTLSSPSAQELAALVDQIKQANAPAIFVGVTTNPNFAEQISRDTGVKLVYVYTGALSTVGEPAATYLQMMEYNAQAITEALK